MVCPPEDGHPSQYKSRRPGIELAAVESQVHRTNHWTTEPTVYYTGRSYDLIGVADGDVSVDSNERRRPDSGGVSEEGQRNDERDDERVTVLLVDHVTLLLPW